MLEIVRAAPLKIRSVIFGASRVGLKILELQKVRVAFVKILPYENDRFYNWNQQHLVGVLNREVRLTLSEIRG
jgi:hypothetical protein